MFLEKKSVRREQAFYADFSEKSIVIEEREIISAYPKDLATNWSLVAHMQRQFKASISEDFGHEYLLTTVEYINSDHISARYKRIHTLSSKKYVLFQLGI